MESELNCTVCGNQYHNDNLPRLLTACGHTYCEQCLDTMMTQQEDGRHRVSCPEDGTVTFLDSNDVSEFPKNIALIKVVESKRNNPGNTFKDQSFDMTKIHKKEDSHDDTSEQDIIAQMESGKENSSSREQTYSKEETAPVQPPTPPKQQYELCLLHQKPMDVVCLLDMTKICAKCAIFGEHKGHEFKSIEQIQEQWDLFRQDIMNLYSRKETLEKAIYNEENSKSIWGIFQQSKRKYQKDITDKFRKLKDYIKKLEQIANKKLQDLTSKAQHKISQILKMDPKIDAEYKTWEERSFGLILKTEECNLEDKLKNLNDYSTTRLVPQGEAILLKLQDLENQIPNYVENIIKGITVESNDELIDALDNYLKISDVKEQPKVQQNYYEPTQTKTRNQNPYEESLLENNDISEAKIQPVYTTIVPSFQQSLVYQKTIQSSHFPPMNSYSNFTPPKIKQHHLTEQSPGQGVFLEKVERPPKKKLKMIRVPEKYEKVLEQLYNDTLDVLDLTNAQLGDNTVLQICEFLRGTKVRTVKLIRNKLSDEIIPKIMFAMHCVVTLNLSQNLFTEHAIDHLISNRNNMPNMKSIILSQNKIIQRKHKGHIQRLRKLDLTVSV